MRPDAPRSILLYFPVGQIGGAERLLLHLLAGLDRRRYQPAAVVVGRGPLAGALGDLGVPCWRLGAFRFRELLPVATAAARLAGLLVRTRARILHVCGAKSLIPAAAAARLTGARLLWHLFDPPPDPPSWQDRLAARCPTDQVVYIARATEAGYAPLLGGRPGRLVRPAVGPPPTVAPEQIARLELRHDIEPGAPVLLVATRLQRFKGVHDLLEAAPAIWAAHPFCRIVVLGGSLFGLEPEYAEALAARAHALDPEGHRLLVTGHVPLAERQAWQARCDLYVHTAHAEPFGLAIAEAMTLGKPVVTTDTEGGRLLADAGRCGRLVPAGDPGALAHQVSALLSDRETARALGAAGQARVRERFGLERMVAEMTSVYDGLLAR